MPRQVLQGSLTSGNGATVSFPQMVEVHKERLEKDPLHTGVTYVNRALTTQVDVVSRKCAANGCKLLPYMNVPGNKRGVYCGAHALEGMVLSMFIVSIVTVCLCCFFHACAQLLTAL